MDHFSGASIKTYSSSIGRNIQHVCYKAKYCHPVFENPALVDEELRTFVGKEPFRHEKVDPLFEAQNPVVPGMMSPR